MVADNGPDQQVKMYDVSTDSPQFTDAIGEQHGVWAGPTPGLTGPTRFSGLWGTGQDNAGNYYVIGNFPAGGTWMRSLKSDGTTMNWQLYGKIWVSSAAPDMAVDGKDVYDHNSLYKMDYSQHAAGTEVTGDFPYAVTVDPWNHPDDTRLHTADANNTYPLDKDASVGAHYAFSFYVPKWIRSCFGQKFMLTTSMYAGTPGIYEQEGNFWVEKSFQNGPDSSTWQWANYLNTNCDLWVSTENGKLSYYPATGVDGSGNLTYGAAVNYPQLGDFNDVLRLEYDRQSDTLYVSGFTNARQRVYGWGEAGSEFIAYSHWKSGGQATFHIDLPYKIAGDVNNQQTQNSNLLKDWDIAGGYLFTGFVSKNDQTQEQATPAIFSLQDGSRTDLTPQSPIVFNDVGWMDVRGISVGQRSNGEYLIFMEDDWKNKVLLYRWCPSGNCPDDGSSATPTTTATPTPAPGLVTAIDAGGSTSGSYVADTDYNAGNQYSDTSASIDTSAVTNPAPQAVYQTCRWNSAFTYTIPNLTPGASYKLRLHWAELTFQGAGQRAFNVAINGNSVLSNFDVYANVGFKKALVKEFTATADSNGNVTIAFTQGSADNPFINGIEIYTA